MMRKLFCWMIAGFVVLFVNVAHADGVDPLLAVDTSSPQATMRSFQTLTEAVETAVLRMRDSPGPASLAELRRLAQKMITLFDLSEVPPVARREVGRDVMAFLVDTLRRVDVPNLDQIPDASRYPAPDQPASWHVPGTEIAISRVMQGWRQGKFLFDADTIAHIGEHYELVKDLPVKVPARISSWREAELQLHGWMVPPAIVASLPDVLKQSMLDTPVWKVLATLLLSAGLALLVVVFVRRLTPAREAHSSRSYLVRLSLAALIIAALYFLAYLAAFQITIVGRFASLVDFALTVATYATMAWAAWLSLFLIAEWIIEQPSIPDQSLDANLLRLLARVLGFFGVASIAALGAQELGVPIVGVLAGLGVGGLAVALAAQSSIENLIGGLNLYADRPIRVGDFCDYAGIQGHVEHIGLRSTRIRALDRTVTSVPNAVIAKVHVTNYASRDQMLFRHILDLRYETTTEQLCRLSRLLLSYLRHHDDVVRDVAEPRVHVIGFGDWSIKVEIYAYVAATELPQFLVIQEELLIAIFDRVRDSGAEFAFPSQTTYLAGSAAETSKELVIS